MSSQNYDNSTNIIGGNEEYIVVDDQQQQLQQQRNQTRRQPQRILINSGKLDEYGGGGSGGNHHNFVQSNSITNYQEQQQQQYSEGCDEFDICDEVVVDATNNDDDIGDGRVLVPSSSNYDDNYEQFEHEGYDVDEHNNEIIRAKPASTKRAKKTTLFENKELYRVPIYKGNTKYSTCYDRLVNPDGSTTDHYICKNYDQCGKIFHRRYLDALSAHMNTCRNKGLINPEECNSNACKSLLARLVVQEPMALGLLTSRAYFDYIGDLSKIIVLRQSIGMSIGKDVLPRHRDLINELMRYLHEDELKLLPTILKEMYQNGFSLETLQINLNDSSSGGSYKVVIATYINNSWELVRTVLKFYPYNDFTATDSCVKQIKQLFSQYLFKENKKFLLEKFHIVSEFEQIEDDDDDSDALEKGMRHPCLLTLLDSVADRLFSEPLPIKSKDFDTKKLVKVRELLRSLREFAEQTRRYKDLRSLLSPRIISNNENSRLLLMLQLSRRWVSSIENISKVLHLTKNSLIKALCAIHSDIFEEKNVEYLWSYVRVMEAFEMSIVELEAVSADNTPSSNLILFIFLGLTKRLNVLKDSSKSLKNCDSETLISLASFALIKLENDFKLHIDKRMIFCALYCDPMGLSHINDLTSFCTMEEVKSVVLVELEHLLENTQSNLFNSPSSSTQTTENLIIEEEGHLPENIIINSKKQQQNISTTNWLSYTEEAQHYEQLTIQEIFNTLELNGLIGIKRDPKRYSPLEFWNVYSEIYPSIARLAKKYFSTSSTLTGAEQMSKQFAPLASSLSFNFKSGELISRMIRLHSIYKNNTNIKPRKSIIIFEKNFNTNNLNKKKKNEGKNEENKKIKKRVKFQDEEEEEDEIEEINEEQDFQSKKKIIKLDSGEEGENVLNG